jgi:2-phospho-L-lactate guanylyltransferase
VVIVPVNRLDRAKGRLADVLTPPQRSELALATLATVLAAVEGTDSRALILSADPAVRDAVAAPHEAADEDRAVSGLNQQLAAAIRVLDAPGVVILHGDLPLVTAGALKSVLDAAPAAPSVTLVESGDGGTNVMLLRPARIIALHYGRGSAALHRTAAASAGASVTTVEVPEIALDLDTPADIQRLLGSEQGRTSAAGRLLRSWGFVADGARSS